MSTSQPPAAGGTRGPSIAEAYQTVSLFLWGFDVDWITDMPTGLMLHCRWCGVHDWAPGETRTLLSLVESALGHRQLCMEPDKVDPL